VRKQSPASAEPESAAPTGAEKGQTQFPAQASTPTIISGEAARRGRSSDGGVKSAIGD
jgi:hypothetical protein